MLDRKISTLQPWYRYGSQYDLQNCILHKLNGINEIQFFVKGKGAWTGLHAEDCWLSSFNINLGPGSSKWIFIPYMEHPKLSSVLAKLFPSAEQMDIRDKWHYFFLSETLLVENGIKHEVVIQEPGHAIFLSGHSLHQVVNLDAGLNIAWNLAMFSFETILDLLTGYDFRSPISKESCYRASTSNNPHFVLQA